jgi:uncharacterized protein
MIHCFTKRTVRPGSEQAFQETLRVFVRQSLDEDSTCGAMMLVPPSDTDSQEFGILRSFPNEEARVRFYGSKLFQDWEQRIESLVVGSPESKELHGLEAFFQTDSVVARRAPPRWKMAILTWMGVWPAVFVWSSLLQSSIASWPHVLRSGVVTAFVVPTLAWGIMPRLTKFFHKWLNSK